MNWNGSQLLKQTKYAKHKGVTEAYISAWIKRDEVSLIKWKLDLKVVLIHTHINFNIENVASCLKKSPVSQCSTSTP